MRSMKVLRINSYSQLASDNKYSPRPNFIVMHTVKKVQLENYHKLVPLSLYSFGKCLLIKHRVHTKSYSRVKRDTKLNLTYYLPLIGMPQTALHCY